MLNYSNSDLCVFLLFKHFCTFFYQHVFLIKKKNFNEKISCRLRENICITHLIQEFYPNIQKLLTVRIQITQSTKWGKDIYMHLTKEDNTDDKNIKRCSTLYIRKCKLRNSEMATSHLLEWPKPRILTTLNASENVE